MSNSTEETAFDEAGQALFRLGRLFSRHPLHQVLRERTGQVAELSQILVAQAVASCQAEGGREVTVGGVAEWLAIDPSTASRLVAETVRAGYLSRAASETDGRSLCLTLTPAGQELVEGAHDYQRAVFEQVTQDWPEGERRLFAQLFIQFAERVAEIYRAE